MTVSRKSSIGLKSFQNIIFSMRISKFLKIPKNLKNNSSNTPVAKQDKTNSECLLKGTNSPFASSIECILLMDKKSKKIPTTKAHKVDLPKNSSSLNLNLKITKHNMLV